MPDDLLGTPAPDFSDPLGLLAACHRRILDHCALLERLLDWLPAHGVDDEVRGAARRVIHYFETAARHHHADEEQDLFPLLRGIEDLAPVLARLHAEHAQLERAWCQLAVALHALVDGQPTGDLAPAVQAFNSAYRAHIAIEDEDLLPVARRMLATPQLRLLGAAMAARRGVSAAATD